MSYKQKYRELAEKYMDLEQDNENLRKELKRVEEARLAMLGEIAALEIRQQNSDKNRQFIDDATNYLGPMAKRLLHMIAMLNNEAEELQQMSDAYYTVGVQWPWENQQ